MNQVDSEVRECLVYRVRTRVSKQKTPLAGPGVSRGLSGV